MTEVHRVITGIRRATGSDPGQVSIGYYTIQDGILTMTHEDGEPVSPDQFNHQLKPGDDPPAIAGVLTKQARRFLLGMSETEEAFNRPIGYSNSGIA